MKNKVEGKGGIYAQVIADSINVWGQRITTFQLHYHRYIHAEFMTHRMFSRNASSSRAIPVKSMIEYIQELPATPIHWGLNQAGMQADGENNELVNVGNVHFAPDGTPNPYSDTKEEAWLDAMHSATFYQQAFFEAGYHKQIVNRLSETFQFMNTIVTATDYDNFFFLRCHPDAQPEIQELAHCMYNARQDSEPELLHNGEYHTPYVAHFRDEDNTLSYRSVHSFIPVEDALKISVSCCAQVSYRKNDTSLEKALSIYDRLVGMKPLHASPFEHIATPFSEGEHIGRSAAAYSLFVELSNYYTGKQAGSMSDQVMYSANFKGWTQLRKGLKGENYIEKFTFE